MRAVGGPRPVGADEAGIYPLSIAFNAVPHRIRVYAQPVSSLRPNPGGAQRERDCDQEEQDVPDRPHG
jgi:hypothetical protein